MYVLVQVEFEKPVDAKGNIEVWLQRLVDGMQDTVKQVRVFLRHWQASTTVSAWCMCCRLPHCSQMTGTLNLFSVSAL